MPTRPDLANVRSTYQVADDQMIDYRPRLYGAVDIPFTDSVKVTKTEGALLDKLTQDHGLMGLKDFDGMRKLAFSEGVARFPDNPLPATVPPDRAREWQGNDGHRDAFRHAYWNAQMAQKYGSQWSEAFATAHEGVPGNTANREAMDLYNNQIGRSIGAGHPNATPKELADLVEQSLNQGKLVVIDRNGQLEWSDRVAKGQHGLAPDEVIGPHLRTPGVVSTDTSISANTAPPAPGQPETRLAATDPSGSVERMRQDPMYAQVVAAMEAKGLRDDGLAANFYAGATREGLSGVASIEIGKPVNDASGQPDRNYFVMEGSTGPLGPAHARVSENEARATSVQVAANYAEQARSQQVAAADQQQERKPVSLNV
ncbi:hypothetical protein LC55x_2987 [Lysobacter capsici]|uniref:DUF6973 domain-containing protein n=1 Tax=Lysobacter capsici TaxID=435897 RepID=UPI000716513B|nr:hypothetical protein [Lysobacter capsici]ALN86252.1 hypothetical protein LC55x_2987 [Lysobacter capsici]